MLCVLNTAHIVHWMWLPRISFVVLYVNLFEFIAHLLFTTALYFFANVHVLRIPWGNAKFYVYFCRCVLMCRIRCTIFHNFRFFFSFHSEEWKRNGSGMLDAFAHWQIGWQKVYYLITAEFSHLFDSFQFAP